VSGASEAGDSLVLLGWGLNYPDRTSTYVDVMVLDTITFDQTPRRTFTTYADTVGPFIGVFAPQGGRVLVSIPDSLSTTIYSLDTHTFQPTTIHTFSGRRIYGLSMNELETEYVVTSGSDSLTLQGGSKQYVVGNDCKIDFYDTSFVLLREIPAPGSCVFDRIGGSFWGGVGTHAADVIRTMLRQFIPKTTRRGRVRF
jgi:hypothetical protein